MTKHGDMEFARMSTMLRAPRLAILISTDGWQQQAILAIQALCGIWGGAGGVIIPVSPSGHVHSALMSGLKRFDPDYLVPLSLSVRDYEAIYPGRLSMTSNNRRLKAESTRRRFVEQFGDNPVGPIVSEADVLALGTQLNTFREDDGAERVYAVRAEEPAGSPISAVPDSAGKSTSFVGTTGDRLLDLAVAARAGAMAAADTTTELNDTSKYDVWDLVLEGRPTGPSPLPFSRSTVGLTRVFSGFRKRDAPLLVVGDSPEDFALAMLLDRTVGDVAWIPTLVGSPRAQHESAGTALGSMYTRHRKPLRATSTSLTEAATEARLQVLWNARLVRPVPDVPLEWKHLRTDALPDDARWTYAVVDAWDRRRSIPVLDRPDGSSEMISPPLLDWPTDLEEADLHWIVEHDRHDRSLPQASCVSQEMLLAADQNPHETFVRASRGAIAYERGRWDFVSSGASVDGRAASPLLRWPSLQEILGAAAAASGHTVRLSDAGRRAQVVTRVWGGVDTLVTDLTGPAREVLDAFIPPTRDNAPYKIGTGQGVARYGRGHVTFEVLRSVCNAAWSQDDLRSWLDDRAQVGAVRRGLLLGCETCGSVDFFPIGVAQQDNECPRCGTLNPLTQARWRHPADEPQWFYDLHPAAADLITHNGDVPLIAWSRYSKASRGQQTSWFEFEVVDGSKRPIVEFDIVGLQAGRLVLGEAKSTAYLDGKNIPARTRDAKKLIEGAARLGADEVLLATTKKWDTGTRTIVEQVAKPQALRVAVLEEVRKESARPDRWK